MAAVDCCLDICRLYGIACFCPCRAGIAVCCWLPVRLLCAPDGSTPYPTSAEWKEYICRPLCSPLPKPTPQIVQPNEGKPTGIITAPPTGIPPLSIPSSNRVPIHGLIIGIDEYHSSPLNGAVYDAKEMEKYLKDDKNVPASQIRCLFNQDAKRSAIINAFQDIQNNPKIQKDDSIIIYYAGHGTKLGSRPNDEIQAIVPYDHSESEGRRVYAIPDLTIGWLLAGIAKAKGDNITVIFDCCHSGSGTTRSFEQPSPGARYLPVNYSHLPRLDDDLRPKGVSAAKPAQPTLRAVVVAPGYEFTGLRSHVLVAACSKGEEAKESFDEPNWRGAFTTAFLDLLRRLDADNLTYAEIPRRIQRLEKQNPQIEGINQHRFIFNSKGRPSVGTVYEVTPGKNGEYTMNAGIAHAISEGAEFTVYQDRKALLQGSQASPLGVLRVGIAKSIKAFSTTLTLSPEATRVELPASVAVQTKAGKHVDLYIYIEPTQTRLPIFQDLATASDNYNIVEAATEELAQLKLSMNQDDDRIVIELLDERATDHGLTRIPLTARADAPSLHAILRRAAHFYRHLDSTTNNKFIPAKITVEFTQVDGDGDMPDVKPNDEGPDSDDDDRKGSGDDSDGKRPVDGDDNKGLADDNANGLVGGLAPVGENLLENGIAKLLINSEAKYAVKITNDTPWDLYLYAFVFDNSDFRIAPYFQLGGAGNPYVVDTFLQKKGGICTIGYGQGGGTPYNFCLPAGQDLDVSFLKFFFTTRPIDLSVVTQQPSIQPQVTLPLRASLRTGDLVAAAVQDIVGMHTITIVQHDA
ncbi:caspase domain-containing protein [Flammula alnicola]|nr:caspase domain-containing protein [Flammula alnicola]